MPSNTKRPGKRYLTISQAADELGRAPSTLREQIRQGSLAAEKIGTDWLIRRTELERYRTASLGRPGRKPGFRFPPKVAPE